MNYPGRRAFLSLAIASFVCGFGPTAALAQWSSCSPSGSYCLSSGNAGVGTTSPSAVLHAFSASGEVRVESTISNSSGWVSFYGPSGRAGYIQLNNGGYAEINFGGPGKLALTGGKVGIGVTSPSIALEVSGAMGLNSTENLTASSGQLVLHSNSSVAMNVGSSTMAKVSNDSGNSILTLGAGTYPRLLFGSPGTMGIGTKWDAGWLDIWNSGPLSIIAGTSYVAAGNGNFLAQDNTSIGVGDNTTGLRMLGTVWSRTGGGNGQLATGISISGAPYAGGNLLFVAGGNESGTYAHAAQSDPTIIIHSRMAAGTATNQWLSFQHNTTNGVVQTGTGSLLLSPASGYVGIGTTTPCSGAVSTCKLAVKGAIRANEVVVDTGWSDYVFAPGYRLTPLKEVGRFIEDNHHLPNIPSAAEVAEKGVGLGDMQAKLLAKIEELTLHMIEADKKNQQLQKRIEQLEANR